MPSQRAESNRGGNASPLNHSAVNRSNLNDFWSAACKQV
ncbi:hypothetical protein PLANPX_4720 [Lacipirellula parvula]|uniref:Uncharacterized protein n=1 Tax=Lacipirellula parvula TaxID=2650471 RepID=A0A5K7XF28_9BACT|nr:hypothetical protein PLANPX_4720 [Lacipirellula parvula]